MRRISLVAFLTAFACAAQAQPDVEPFDLPDCQGPLAQSFARTLAPAHPSTAQLPAQALWLDATRLRWPQAEPGARTRLLFSARSQLQAVPGEPAAGIDEALLLAPHTLQLPQALRQQHAWFGPGPVWQVGAAQQHRLRALHRGQLLLVQEDAAGRVLRATAVQHAPALDALYGDAAARLPTLGVSVAPPAQRAATDFRLWAPSAQQVALCLHADGRPETPATELQPMQRDAASGAWQWRFPRDLSGFTYTYLVDVHVPGHGLVRQRVTDPYSLSLNTDSERSWIGRLDDPRTMPPGWASTPRPPLLRHPTQQAIYELHVRDFSAYDGSVRAPWRGKYLAFTEPASDGTRHLQALKAAGITDVHLLPVFDLATVPETGCLEPPIAQLGAAVQAEGGASLAPQAWVAENAAQDCFNWGYDPWHFNAPEGSFATNAHDGAVRIRELRAMVQALHRAGLRVGMDVVYNHTTASGQHPKSVLDRIVPGYYQRLDAQGRVERSTCCDNTATEHLMMERLMVDSAVLWAREHRIDSFRFDLMGHQPRAAMERLQRAVDRAAGRRIHLIGEGWNFGEVADGKRFVQASQLSLPGSGIATFSDRARDAVRGGGAGDSGAALVQRKGWAHGRLPGGDPAEYARLADLVRVGLAGTLREFMLPTHDGRLLAMREVDYAGQPAGYAAEPAEVVNYVENHDNLTLFDSNVFKLPPETPPEERARVQLLALATTAFSQGIAYFHAGSEVLRSKSLDRNSYDSGDWFNRLDWTLQNNFFATGLPPRPDNEASWPQMTPLLQTPGIQPRPEDIRFTRDATLDLLRIRSSTPLFTLPTAAEVQRRLGFLATGPGQPTDVIVAHLDGRGLAGAARAGGFRELVYVLNAAPEARRVSLPTLRGKALVLHPVHLAPGAADRRPAQQARWDPAEAMLSVPARTALVYVAD